jgi:hypothetical protein
MSKILVDSSFDSRTWADYDEDKDALTVWEEFNADADLRLAKILSDKTKPKADGMRQERIIPEHVLSRAFSEGWYHDKAAWKRWANSEEGMALAVQHNGKINRL